MLIHEVKSNTSILTRIVLKRLTNQKDTFFITPRTRVVDLKVFWLHVYIQDHYKALSDIDVNEIQFFFNRQQLSDNTAYLVSDYGIKDDDMLHITFRLIGGAKTKHNKRLCPTAYYTTRRKKQKVKRFLQMHQ